MKLGIVGSRRRNLPGDFRVVMQKVKDIMAFVTVSEIISGGCPKGADHFAEQIAKELEIPIKIFPANWKLGRHAGFLRNTDIAKESDLLIACVASDRTGGTEDTIKKFEKFHGKGKIYLV